MISLQTLGVRDTRTLFGIQILEKTEGIWITLPDEEKTCPVMERARWLSEIKIRNHRLCFPSPAPEGVVLGYDSMALTLQSPGLRWSGRSFPVKQRWSFPGTGLMLL